MKNKEKEENFRAKIAITPLSHDEVYKPSKTPLLLLPLHIQKIRLFYQMFEGLVQGFSFFDNGYDEDAIDKGMDEAIFSYTNLEKIRITLQSFSL